MDLGDAEAHFRAGRAGQGLAYCEELLVGLLVEPGGVLDDAGAAGGTALDEALVEDAEVHGGAAEGGESQVPGARDDGGDALGQGGGVCFVGLV